MAIHHWIYRTVAANERLDFFQFNFRLYPKYDDSVKRASRDEIFIL